MTRKTVENYIKTYFGSLKNKDVEDFFSHGIYCEKIAKELFKGLTELNILDENELALYKKYENILYIGACIHDIGNFIPGDKPHNKRGAKFILKNPIKELNDVENLILANLVRFHRGKSPKDKNKMYGMLNDDLKPVVKFFAGILRIADALDFGHYEIVDNITLKDGGEKLYITLDCDMKNNVGFNLVFKKKKKLLGKVLNRKIVIES